MKALVWFVLAAIIVAIVYFVARLRRQMAERQDAAEARMVSFIAQVRPSAPPLATSPAPTAAPVQAAAPQERLLLEAAAKAGEAGEPVLSIQLYAKLLSRYPQTSFAPQARAAVEQQKKKLSKT